MTWPVPSQPAAHASGALMRGALSASIGQQPKVLVDARGQAGHRVEQGERVVVHLEADVGDGLELAEHPVAEAAQRCPAAPRVSAAIRPAGP